VPCGGRGFDPQIKSRVSTLPLTSTDVNLGSIPPFTIPHKCFPSHICTPVWLSAWLWADPHLLLSRSPFRIFNPQYQYIPFSLNAYTTSSLTSVQLILTSLRGVMVYTC